MAHQLKEKQKEIFTKLKDTFGYTNVMQTPRIEKVSVSVGTGRRAKTDRNFNKLVEDRISKITGQKPSLRGAKHSIAGFKIRTGDPIGYSVTLRGKRAESFFDKLIDIAFPRTKDFRGITRASMDKMGNLTIGMREHSVFPECAEEDLHNVFGLSVTIVTTAKTKAEGEAYLESLGFPFKTVEESVKKKKSVSSNGPIRKK